jgi:sugar O-acyltransferase (sialic acid O-acetyltransferase NeuD family)
MIKIRLSTIGAGGHGCSVAESAELSGHFEVVGFLDDALAVGERVLGSHVFGSVASFADHCSVADHAIVAIGNNAVREKLMDKLTEAGYAMVTVVHPRAFVFPSALVGQGSAIMVGAIQGTEARLGVGCIVNCGAVVDHQATVEDFGHLGVNASIDGCSLLGRSAWMQAGAALWYGVMVPSGEVLPPGKAREMSRT